ncbi:MAG TPA: pseudouridine synthase [Candidatus Saccharimonadia bacterium]
MRINRFVASATGLSRRAADTAIAAGRVTIDGHTAMPGDAAEASQAVQLDGQPISLPEGFRLVILNKPVGYVSSRTRQGADPTLYQLIPKPFRSLRIAGRLDRDSSGLILLTDDGDTIFRLTHPSFNKLKVYDVALSHDLSAADRDRLAAGVTLTDGPSKLGIISANGPEVRVSLSEGRNRQVRRTFGALGYETVRLHRLSIGPYELGDLPEGAWKQIEPLPQ